MLLSGFIDGRLLYILEFPFKTISFIEKLELQLKRRFKNGDVKGQFLRSAYFSYKDYIYSDTLNVVYVLEEEHLKEYAPYIITNFLKFLYEHA